MYLQHFGLTKSPFSLTPDPIFLFLTAKHREALAGLLFAVTERKGFMVLTGDAGTGKTTLVRKLLLSIPVTCAQFSVIVNPALTRSEFLESVLMDFGEQEVPSSKALRLSLFKNLLLKAYREGKTSVLVIDEAHLLTGELIEEVRLLSNFETSEQKLLQILLVGQNELTSVLRLESMRQVRQRVAIRMHIDPLAAHEVKRYLQTRWARAAAQVALPFSDDAMELVANASAGIPRVVNVICDAALVNACGAGIRNIGVRQVEEVLQDLCLTVPNHIPLTEGASRANSSSREFPALSESANVPAIRSKSVERYMPETRQVPKFWRIGSWFRTTTGAVK
jgi:general secretion pathway protein A